MSSSSNSLSFSASTSAKGFNMSLLTKTLTAVNAIVARHMHLNLDAARYESLTTLNFINQDLKLQQ